MLFCMVQPSVDVVYIHRYAGLNSPCKWFTVIGIFSWGIRDGIYTPETSGHEKRAKPPEWELFCPNVNI